MHLSKCVHDLAHAYSERSIELLQAVDKIERLESEILEIKENRECEEDNEK